MEHSTSRVWGHLPDGREVRRITLSAPGGICAIVCDYGCTIISLFVPDRSGHVADIVLGYDSLEQYLRGSTYFGCVVGRYANRIAGGAFSLDGITYRLAANNAPAGKPCHLHGGLTGFDKVLWNSEAFEVADETGVRFSHRSPHGSEGYPGNLDVVVTYTVNSHSELRIEYEAVCERPTILNLTNHSYFNLAGHDSGSILDHDLKIAADHFTPVNAGLIPTGEIRNVAHSPFDFDQPMRIAARIDAVDPQLRFGSGYDHNFVLRGAPGLLKSAATVRDQRSGRQLEVLTTQPGLQLYSGNFLDGSDIGKGGCKYARHAGLCLETQHFPDSPNQPRFPSVVLRPGDRYRELTVYRFSAE